MAKVGEAVLVVINTQCTSFDVHEVLYVIAHIEGHVIHSMIETESQECQNFGVRAPVVR